MPAMECKRSNTFASCIGSTWILTTIRSQLTMDLIDPICSAISFIIALAEKIETTKANKERCQRIARRVRLLEEMVFTIKQRGPGQISNIVCKSLNELWHALISAKNLMMTFSQTKTFKSFVLSKTHEDQFCKVNERLTENLQSLSGALHIEQGDILHRVHESLSRQNSVSSSAPVPPPPVPTPPTPAATPLAPPPPVPTPPTPAATPLAPPPSVPTPPTPAPAPSAPMPLPMPTAPLPLRMRMPFPMAPLPHPVLAYPRTVPTTVFRAPGPPSFRYVAVPGPCITSAHVSHPLSPMPLPQGVPLSPPIFSSAAPAALNPVIVSPSLSPTSSMPVNGPVTIISVRQQKAPTLASSVKSLFN